jgi:hypothetical protein
MSNLYVGRGNTTLLQFSLKSLPAGLTSNQVARATLVLFADTLLGQT